MRSSTAKLRWNDLITLKLNENDDNINDKNKIMSNNRSLLQTKNFKLPSPTHPERRSPITISLHSTQRSNIFTPKFEAEPIDRKKSMPLACERKLKARIMEIIGEKN